MACYAARAKGYCDREWLKEGALSAPLANERRRFRLPFPVVRKWLAEVSVYFAALNDLQEPVSTTTASSAFA